MKRSPLRRTKGLRRRSTKQAARQARLKALSMGLGLTRCAAGIAADCKGWATEHHHRLARSQGGTDDETNLIPSCGPCHSAIHANPEEAYRLGLLVRRWSA